MAIEGFQTLLDAVKQAIPDVFIKRRLNFITIHYLYIGGMALFWSAMFYAMGGLPYIDSLFFTSGAATQSGLNTSDVNLLNTGQQLVLYMLAMCCNPITINTSVVFVRLYWFEKRFKDVVKEAQKLRRTRSRSKQRRNSFKSDDPEAHAPTSVRGRALQLLKNTGHRAEGRTVEDNGTHELEDKEKQTDSSNASHDPHIEADEKPVRRSSADSLDNVRLPQQMSAEQHIQFLEKQRNPGDTTTFHVPSPREMDSGGRIQSVSESSDELDRQPSRFEQQSETSPEFTGAPRVQHHITFNEPVMPFTRTTPKTSTFPRVETAKASTVDKNTYYDDPRGRVRPRRGSNNFLRTPTGRTMEATPYLSWQPTVARNSFFVNLTEEQREELGGIEYRALKTLALILLCYFFLFHIFGLVCLTPWIYHTHWGSVVTGDGQSRAWWGVFTAGSAFNDLGFTLTPDSMVSFQEAVWPILLMSFLIIIGNTGFPCMLRFIIWVVSKCVPVGSGLWEELQFLLDHPRRCFTLLFPRAATWWLTAVLVILNAVDLFFFVVLDLNDPTVTSLSPGIRVMVGIFQAASTRTAGFAAVNIANLHPGIQVSYLIMMYISVFPIAISVRRTNVYEEKSLGIYGSAEETEGDDKETSYVGAHLRKQLSFDLWYVFLGLFLICCIEGSRLENTNEYAFTIFSVLFEIISAYGTVGLSLGYPTVNASFSSQFTTVSKLIIIAMQIRGRHRGLPYELDRAILLPSESLHRKEAQEADRLLQRRPSMFSTYDNRGEVPRAQPEGFASATSYRSTNETNAGQGHNDDPSTGPRQRRLTNKSTASSNTSARKGLGAMMYKVANAEQAIEEEADHATHSLTN